MRSPFPGMDPYLETPHLWPDVHHGLINQIRGALTPVLRPLYVARVEMRVYISDEEDPGREALFPGMGVGKLIDDQIEEARLEIRPVKSDSAVTVIEVVSPANKIPGAYSRASFMKKRQEILASDVHWVEIDLLRAGVPADPLPALFSSDYRVLVVKSAEGTRAPYWPVSIRQPLPVIGIPLRRPDPDVPLDLGAVLQTAYDSAAYDLSIDYRREPDPPLQADDAAWADQLLRKHKLR